MKKYLAIVLAVLMVMALCACGDKAEEAAPEEAAAPAAEAASAAEAPAEGGATGEMGGATGEMAKLDTSSDFEITVDGVSGTAHYEDTDNGDQATKGFTITWQGNAITGAIDKGVWTADDAANQAVVDAVQAAFESNNAVGPASGEPSGEM